MLLIISGEGPSDIGVSKNGSNECGIDDFSPGPLSLHLFLEIEKIIQYSPLVTGMVFWASRSELSRIYKENKQSMSIAFPGAKSAREMLSFARTARAFGIKAIEIEARVGCQSVGVLFHDSDGTVTDSINRWDHIVSAINSGFHSANYYRGVAMIPKPKQEAWFLCGLKDNPYDGCDALENYSGNDASPNNLKGILKGVLGKEATTDTLVEVIQTNRIDWDRINMPSYIEFRNSLIAAINLWRKYQ